MLALAASAESVRHNIDRYWKGARANPDLIKDAAKVKQWKCYRTHDGEWRCGPSRFVGYEGMTPIKYVKCKKAEDGGLNGTETQYHLRQWTEDVAENSKLHRRLTDVVSEYLEKAGLSVNSSARFSILGSDACCENAELNDSNEKAVEALVILSKALPMNYRRSLIRRLETL